ncbi:MAG: hypothetical protein ABEJ26_10335 [Halosimplex sp.]
MEGDVRDEATAVDVAREYADEECVGQFGDVLAVDESDGVWTVELTTHTFSAEYTHRLKLTAAGNVFAHERDG